MLATSSSSTSEDLTRSSSYSDAVAIIPSPLRNSSSGRITLLTQSAPLPNPQEIAKVASGALLHLEEEVIDEDQRMPTITVNSSSPVARRDGRKVMKTSLTVLYRFGQDSEKQKEEIEEEGISKEFIDKYNTLFGDKKQRSKAERFSKNMRKLAGLEPSVNPPDISEARVGLCLLAGLKDENLKMEALTSLEELLLQDPKTPETASNLITFACNFFNLITKKEFKTESPKTQHKIEEIYDVLLPLLQSHFELGNIGPITPELKSQLTIAAITLGKVNSKTEFEKNEYSIDIPSARLDLCQNAADPDDKSKIEALTSLDYILKHDPCTPETASRLVDLAVNYLALINRAEFQKEVMHVQIKMVEVYDALIELLQRQYINEHIGGITHELKIEFTNASRALESLNTHNDQTFKYHIRCALQGSRRLADDRQALFDYLNRGFQVVAGIVSMGVQEVDAGITRIENEMRKIDFRLKHTWYDNTLILKNLGREAFGDPRLLLEALRFIGMKTPKTIKDKGNKEEQRWEFYFTAIDILKNICLKGLTREIRLLAMNGASESPGLATLASIDTLKEYRDMDKVKRLGRPAKIDPNLLIRQRTVDSLGTVALNAVDDNVRIMAKRILSMRLVDEENPKIKEKIKSLLPSHSEAKKKKPHITT